MIKRPPALSPFCKKDPIFLSPRRDPIFLSPSLFLLARRSSVPGGQRRSAPGGGAPRRGAAPLRAPPEEELPLARAPSTGPLTSAAASPAPRVLRQAAAGGAALQEHPRRRSRPLALLPSAGPLTPTAHRLRRAGPRRPASPSTVPRRRGPLPGCSALGHATRLHLACHDQDQPRPPRRRVGGCPAMLRAVLPVSVLPVSVLELRLLCVMPESAGLSVVLVICLRDSSW